MTHDVNTTATLNVSAAHVAAGLAALSRQFIALGRSAEVLKTRLARLGQATLAIWTHQGLKWLPAPLLDTAKLFPVPLVQAQALGDGLHTVKPGQNLSIDLNAVHKAMPVLTRLHRGLPLLMQGRDTAKLFLAPLVQAKALDDGQRTVNPGQNLSIDLNAAHKAVPVLTRLRMGLSALMPGCGQRAGRPGLHGERATVLLFRQTLERVHGVPAQAAQWVPTGHQIALRMAARVATLPQRMTWQGCIATPLPTWVTTPQWTLADTRARQPLAPRRPSPNIKPGRERPLQITVISQLDGREVARNTTQYQAREANRPGLGAPTFDPMIGVRPVGLGYAR